jgi:hypothetical protein
VDEKKKTNVCTHYLCVAERKKVNNKKNNKRQTKEAKEEEAVKNTLQHSGPRESRFKLVRRRLYEELPVTGVDSGEECSPILSTPSSEKGADSVFGDGEDDELFLRAAGSPTSKVLPREG